MAKNKCYKQSLKNITTFMFDVDGVLTDSMLLIMPTGELLRRMNVKDGYSMQYAMRKGFRIIIITGGRDQSVQIRFKNLGINDVAMNCHEKLDKYEEYLLQYGLKDEEILYMGDDIPDVPPMSRAGVACCPADAATEVRAVADYISGKKGGEGCVRDVIEQTLKAQGCWEKADLEDFIA